MADERDPPADLDDRDALEGWGADWKAPPSLRKETVRAARERGLLKGMTMNSRRLWFAAAAIAAFLVGYGLGGRSAGRPEVIMESSKSEAPPAAAAGPQYALMLFENNSYQTPAGEAEMEARIGEYTNWARTIAEAGRFITGEKLSDEGRWCRIEGGAMAVATPAIDPARGALAGYFVVGAGSFDEAMELAKGCPHLKYGGSVEIRRIET